jgi:orotidine-5'-phosphate decarboxylase
MSAKPIPPHDRLIIALDLPDVRAAETMIHRLGDAVSFYKVGLELALAGGIPLARALANAGKKVFLDLKLHDIGNTVAHATARAAELGATFLTVHAFAPTLRAAIEGRAGSALKILAVTVLTSWDEGDVKEAGYALPLPELVRQRARTARALGADGLVASAAEAADLRPVIGSMLLVTPGIRPSGAAAGDQKRIFTPKDAIRAGADYLVVGRPVLEAKDPKAAAEAIVAEITQAQQ